MKDEGRFSRQYEQLIENTGHESDSTRLLRFFAIAWEQLMADFPEWATSVGHPGYDDRWTDWSFEAIEQRRQDRRLRARVLQSIDHEQLSGEDRLSYDLFDRDLHEEMESERFHSELQPVNQMAGVQQEVARYLSMMPAKTTVQCENILARLAALPVLIEQVIALMDSGLQASITPPRVTLTEVPQQVANQIVAEPEKAPTLAFLGSLSSRIDESLQQQIRHRAAEIYTSQVAPAFRLLHEYLTQTYLPGCRESTAWSDLPDGSEWYAFLVRRYTTTDLTPDEIFAIGQKEVARIRLEMDKVIAGTGFEGGFAAFCDFLRTDERFFFDRADDLLREYRDIAKRVDPELIKLFGRLPRLPYGVIAVPSYAEKSQTTGGYQPGSLQAGRPGYYYANTYDLKSRPKWEMEALTLHEAVPGHHLQIALAQELEDLPEFRRQGWYTAYGEGWALYAESLGDVMGFYKDPYARFGQLTYEMWRAIRLVVDVGLHTKGWSRQQAIDFFQQNSSKTEHDIEVEVDRYIVWPGQALAYKIGELSIKQLRTIAEKELGEKFDIRAFHDELLRHGCLPLNILEAHMTDWVRSQQ
ncbi:MAG: DUF885 domain-containing protein [bacterium]